MGPFAAATWPRSGRRWHQWDRFFALLMVRALIYGPEYVFGVSCRKDSCRARIEWEIDLTKLPVRRFSEESRAAFVGGKPRCARSG